MQTEYEKRKCRQCGKQLPRLLLLWTARGEREPEPKVGAQTPWGVVCEIVKVEDSTFLGKSVTFWTGRWGYHGNGFFCTLRCGFTWAKEYMTRVALP